MVKMITICKLNFIFFIKILKSKKKKLAVRFYDLFLENDWAIHENSLA